MRRASTQFKLAAVRWRLAVTEIDGKRAGSSQASAPGDLQTTHLPVSTYPVVDLLIASAYVGDSWIPVIMEVLVQPLR